MTYTDSSIILKSIAKLDLSSIADPLKPFNDSRVINFISDNAGKIKKNIVFFSSGSFFCKNIDNLIIANLLLLFLVISFASTGLIGFLVITSLVLTVLKWILISNESHNKTIIDIPVLVYVLIAVLSVAFSSYFMPSLKGLAKIMIYLASYISFTNIFQGESKKLYLLLGFLTFIGGIEAFYGIYQQLHGVEALATWQDPESIKPDENMSRVYGTLQPFNPNLLAGYLLPIFPLAMGLGAIAFIKKVNWIGALSLLFSLTILTCLIFTGSRGAFIGILGIFATIYLFTGHLVWYSKHQHAKLLRKAWVVSALSIIVLGIAAVVILPGLQDRIESIFTLRGNSSNSFRMNVYIASFKMFLDNWLIGIGPGNTTFRLVYGLYMVTGFDALGSYSVPLEIAVEMGIIGLVSFLWFILVVVSNSVKAFLSDSTLEVKILIATILTGLVGMAGQGLFDTIWFRPQVHIIFWCFIAVLANIISKKVMFKK